MRTIVDLTDEQIEDLRRLCERKHISRAEAVRRGVALLLRSEEETVDDLRRKRRQALKAAFGSWKDHGIDGLEYQRQIRAEWDREWDPD
ncbi:MAG: CopG family transcriptional regulator [Dehalococcoidia bacterium]